MSTKKRKQEHQERKPESNKRRKLDDSKPTQPVPDSKLSAVPVKPSVPQPQVKLGKKNVVLNANWAKVQATLPPTHPGRARRLERERKAKEEEEAKKEAEERKTKGKVLTVKLPVSDSTEPTKILALDCEMVGVGIGGFDSALARVTVLNTYGNTIYDKFVLPQEEVVDYRTKYSGIRKEDLIGAPSFQVVQKEIADLIKGRIVVGHGLKSDFQALMLQHPFTHIRDTARYRPLQRNRGRPFSLRVLMKKLLGVEIQSGEHDSGEDARAALLLYKKFKVEWEQTIGAARFRPKKKKVITNASDKSEEKDEK